jgi:hypothetical protein
VIASQAHFVSYTRVLEGTSRGYSDRRAVGNFIYLGPSGKKKKLQIFESRLSTSFHIHGPHASDAAGKPPFKTQEHNLTYFNARIMHY